MRVLRTNILSLGCFGVLAACTASPPSGPPWLPGGRVRTRPLSVPASGRPDELAERGIGGTGGATRPPAPSAPIRPSLGVAGIQPLPGTTVTADGMPDRADDLRIGQQAVMAVALTDDRPVTDHLMIRHAVIGPIDRVREDSGLIVAGQTVRLTRAPWIDAPLRAGQWVAVSGLRTPSGDILASRVDPATGPNILIDGLLQGSPAQPRIGLLPVKVAGEPVSIGSSVVVRGVEADGTFCVTVLRPDLLTEDPEALFGGDVHRFLIQTLAGPGVRPARPFKPGMAPMPGENSNGFRLALANPAYQARGLKGVSSGSPPATAGYALKLMMEMLAKKRVSRRITSNTRCPGFRQPA